MTRFLAVRFGVKITFKTVGSSSERTVFVKA